MLFMDQNPAVNTLVGLDGDLLVDNYIAKSIIPKANLIPETSVLDSLSIAVQAGIYGMANNAINIGNFLGGDAETYDVATELGDLGSAYSASKDSYDLAGNIITSLVPGGLAFAGLRAMKLAQSGGLISRTIGFADNRSRRLLEETASVYRNSLNVDKVRQLKMKAYGWSTLDEVVSGAIIGASIEVSQNLGGILVDDSLTFGEKVSKFAAPIGLGAIIGAPFGGLQYLANAREIVKPAVQAKFGIMGDLSYRGLDSRANKITRPEYASNHMLDEIDRIDGYTPIGTDNTVMIDLVKDEFKAQAQTQYKRYLSEITTGSSVKGIANTPEEKEVFKALNGLMEEGMKSPEGRASLRNLMDNVYKADTSTTSPAQAIFSATRDVQQRDIAVLAETPSVTGLANSTGIDFAGRDFKMVPLTDKVRKSSKRLKPENKPQSVMMINTDHPSVMNDLDKYKVLNRIIGATSASDKSLRLEANIVRQLNNVEGVLRANSVDVVPEAGIFEQLAKAKSMLKESGTTGYTVPAGVDKLTFTNSMNGLFNAMDEAKASEFLLESVSAKWLNLVDNSISTKASPNLYGANLSNISKPTTINSRTNLLGIQKLRLQAGKNLKDKKAEDFDKAFDSKAGTAETKLKGWTELEYRLNKALLDGKTDVPISKTESLSFAETYTRVREGKREAAVKLLNSNDADDVMLTLGVNDMEALMAKGATPANPTKAFMEKVIKDTSELTDMRSIRLSLKARPLSPEATLLRSADESSRIQDMIKLKTTASQIVGQNLDEIFPTMPDLGYVDENSNVGQLLFDSHLKGDMGGVNFATVNIGDANMALASRLKGKMEQQYGMTERMNTMLNNPESAGELSAAVHWYRGQKDKFVPYLEADGSYTLLDAKSSAKYNKYKTEAEETLEPVLPVEDWVKANPTTKTNSYTVRDEGTVDYLQNFQTMNYAEVQGPKRQAEEAWGNTLANEEDYFYFPPRDLPFSRFFRVESTDPLSQTKSTVYKVHAKSERELGAQITAAEKSFREKGIKAKMVTGADAQQQAALNLHFNWDGLEQNFGKAVSTTERKGAAPDVALSTIQELNADMQTFIKRSSRNVANAATELYYADEISRLRSLAKFEDTYRIVGDDTLRGKSQKVASPGTFQTLHNQMLGRDAPFSVYNQVNNFVSDTMATMLQPLHSARIGLREALSKTGEITRKDIMKADEIAQQALKDRGLESPIGKAVESYLAKETTLTGADINEGVAALSHIASTLMLRIDGIDPIMNLLGTTVKLSSEMKYINQVVAGDPVLNARVQDVYAKWAGAGVFKGENGVDISLLSPFKMMATAVKDMGTLTVRDNKTSTKALDFLKDLQPYGIYKDDIRIMMELNESLVIPQGLSSDASKARFLGGLRDGVKKAEEYLTTPHKVSVNISQYAALKFAADIADAAGVDLATKRMLMNGMNTRVNAIGSHVSKPRLFQGLVGSTISLYQSYFSHTIGNLVRHASSVGSGPVIRNVAMNSTFFGMQSTPAFDAINAQVAYQQDKNNADIYSSTYDILPEPVADAMMFGVGSAVLRANLTSRGDLTPRYVTVIPTNVIDLPVVNAVVNTVGAVVSNSYKAATGGQTLGQAAMNTVIDSKLNRPLNGIMSLIQGRSTDSRHNLVSTHDDLFSWASAVRVAGAKPMDEARVNQAYWNLQSYRTKDQERKANLANLMKQEFGANPAVMNNPEWINSKYQSYINAGGNHRNFKRFYEQNVLKASTSFEQRLQVSIKDLDVARNYKNVLGLD